MEIKAVQGTLRAGDIITMEGNFEDRRNWWQRHAPYWLGGKDAPMPPELRRFKVSTTMCGEEADAIWNS